MYPESKCHFLLQILMDFDYFSYIPDMESIDFHLFCFYTSNHLRVA